jgi:hypothetical protein
MQMANGLSWTFDDGPGQRATFHSPTTNSTLNIGSAPDTMRAGIAMHSCCVTGIARDMAILAAGPLDYPGTLDQAHAVTRGAIANRTWASGHIGQPPEQGASRKAVTVFSSGHALMYATESVSIVATAAPGLVELNGEHVYIIGKTKVSVAAGELKMAGHDNVLITSTNTIKMEAMSELKIRSVLSSVALKASTEIILEASTRIKLKCGPSSITITPTHIILNGPQLIANQPTSIGPIIETQ